MELKPKGLFGDLTFGEAAKFENMNLQDRADNQQRDVATTGTANESCTGPPMGVFDIGQSESAYIFRVVLPGTRKDRSKVKCHIKRDGLVRIEGVLDYDEIEGTTLKVFEMKVQGMPPPGPFSISFYLPGPVDPRLFSVRFNEAVLEGVVMKYIVPSITSGDESAP